MSRVTRIALRAVAGIASVGLGISIITGCSASSGLLSASPDETDAATAGAAPLTETTTPSPPSGPDLQTIDGHTFSAIGPGDCATNAMIAIDREGPGKLLGELTDMGASGYAAGPVGYDEHGRIETYTVQPGDALAAIGERFCIDYITVGVYNHRMPPGKTIQPGDILVLRPDPTVTWSPDDAYAPPAP
ncbi:LysM domain-containing protein [Microbacterium sp.]|uniref:LysM peptidoglycan-binding domain-containing protein n=1 Tax=unclassified Microbacterium TaxID=2609290 RepID=UPI002606B200|nr:LysM domain-containing protein [Microbacterium sp.]